MNEEQQSDKQVPDEQQNYSQPYEEPQQRVRRQKPPKVGVDTRVEQMDPKKRKLYINLFRLGIYLVLIYAILSFLLIHLFDANNGFAFRGDYMGYVNSDFLVAAIPMIFLWFGHKILKGQRKINMPQGFAQQQQGQSQQPVQTQQPRQQTQFKIPENPYRQQQSYKPPENIFAQKDTHWKVPPNYWGGNQSYQQSKNQGSWKCPQCSFLEVSETCRKCGYRKRM